MGYKNGFKNSSQREYTFLMGELFCGPGGLAFAAKNSSITNGAKNYSISHGWSTDYHEDACETYRHNICPDNLKMTLQLPLNA